MFEDIEIPNDLAYVDMMIREYYGIPNEKNITKMEGTEDVK